MARAFVFPGQGSQSVGMGKVLAEQFRSARDVFDEVDEALGEKLSSVIWEGHKETLALTRNTQPALFAVSMAVIKVFEQEFGIRLTDAVRYVAGHSLGEYSALTAAGAFSISDAASLLRVRGEAMQKAVPVGEGAMIALLGVGIDIADKIACKAAHVGICEIANDNDPTQVVLSGTKAAIDRVADLSKSYGVRRAVVLPVSAPFHCSLMQPAARVMAEKLSNVKIRKPVIPVVTNVTATPVSDPDKIRLCLVEQVTDTVQWRQCIMTMTTAGINEFFEIGVGKILCGLIGRIDKSVKSAACETSQDISALATLISAE
ncbi:MAG: Malonyl CoA-acyl carrier protein transacylase [Hyphomicrobiaceae bacterium hypho_1]